jgi:hypothetical protein
VERSTREACFPDSDDPPARGLEARCGPDADTKRITNADSNSQPNANADAHWDFLAGRHALPEADAFSELDVHSEPLSSGFADAEPDTVSVAVIYAIPVPYALRKRERHAFVDSQRFALQQQHTNAQRHRDPELDAATDRIKHPEPVADTQHVSLAKPVKVWRLALVHADRHGFSVPVAHRNAVSVAGPYGVAVAVPNGLIAPLVVAVIKHSGDAFADAVADAVDKSGADNDADADASLSSSGLEGGRAKCHDEITARSARLNTHSWCLPCTTPSTCCAVRL